MKNTVWYCHKNLKPLGPFSEVEVREKIHRGEVGPQDLICDETGSWKPASEWGIFEFQLFPAVQGLIQGADFDEGISEWVLLVEQGEGQKPFQEGPFSIRELKGLVEAGQVSVYQYVWKSGLSGWCQMKDRAEFSSLLTSKRLSDPFPV